MFKKILNTKYAKKSLLCFAALAIARFRSLISLITEELGYAKNLVRLFLFCFLSLFFSASLFSLGSSKNSSCLDSKL